MKSNVVIIESAERLPKEWDKLSENNFLLKKENLAKVEKSNPCEQKYYIFCNTEVDSIVTAYKLRLNIFTYSKFSLKLPVTMISLPYSVCKKGYSLGKGTKGDAFEFIKNIKGPKLILNSDDEGQIDGFSKGITLPTFKLNIRWLSFEDYVNSMRSHYKYRIRKALNKGAALTVREINPSTEFDKSLYDLYLNVYKASEYKLEKLSMDFFKEVPARIFKFELGKQSVGFIQIQKYGEEMMFLFGGFDYSLNTKYDIYINMLLQIVRTAIEEGCNSVDFGQTAEDTKLKLGCKSEEKYMYFNHSNAFLNFVVGKAMRLLSYDKPEKNYLVFKGEH